MIIEQIASLPSVYPEPVEWIARNDNHIVLRSQIMKNLMTLCYVRDGQKILLGMKKKGFGQGRWNGFGGKVEAGETLEEATIREVKEEAGISVSDLIKRGLVIFEYEHRDSTMEVHIFETRNYEGMPEEREKLIPQWFDQDNLPIEKMWPDDRYWMPLFLGGKNFEGRFSFSDYDNIIGYELRTVEMQAQPMEVALQPA
jgi:8-oxo-dGTP diphosphatase / 2-hydroxy-dATP diphosphatase